MQVDLTMSESTCSAMVGVFRNLASIFKGSRSSAPADKLWQVHIEGALGEAAVAKALNTYNPLTVNTFKGADIGHKIQVRTRSQHGYDLIVRTDDSDDEVYVLVTGSCPSYIIQGWCYGHEAKQPEHLANHGGRGEAWFVPASKLKPITDMPEEAL